MQTILALLLLVCAASAQKYLAGDQGESCTHACLVRGMVCNSHIETNSSVAIFAQVGLKCVETEAIADWWATDQPSVAVDPADPNYGKCIGWRKLPEGVLCAGSHPSVRRVCRCDAPDDSVPTFGTAAAGVPFGKREQWVFGHRIATPGQHYGVMTHLWLTYDAKTDPGTTVRIYVDDEAKASIEFQPSMACGTGFFDEAAPWGTKWIGHGSKNGAWFWNLRVPFYKSLAVTIQHTEDNHGYYMIVRGALDLPIDIAGVKIPTEKGARLKLYKTQGDFQPLAFVPIAEIPSGHGVHFMHTLSVSAANLNFLEGCYHMYTGLTQTFPGILLSSGTEDYFDSAWYFDAGEFRFPVSGYTHYKEVKSTATAGKVVKAGATNGNVEWSAYRFHEMDPLLFNNGFRMYWRNGDMLDKSGAKCQILSGGTVVGSPSVATVISYAFVYTWN